MRLATFYVRRGGDRHDRQQFPVETAIDRCHLIDLAVRAYPQLQSLFLKLKWAKSLLISMCTKMYRMYDQSRNSKCKEAAR